MREDTTINKFDRIMKGLIFLGIFGLLDLILFGVFKYSGNLVKNVLVGVFGYAFYGYCIAGTVASIFVLLGFTPKVSFRVIINYILILIVIICIGHLVTYKEFASYSYGSYVATSFLQHDSLAGAAFAWFMYPFAKLYVFSIIVFSFALIGLIALVIVNQLNFDIGLKLRNRSKKGKSVTAIDSSLYVNSNYQIGAQKEINEPTRELYNGDVNGRTFNSGKSRGSRKVTDFEYTPIEEVGNVANEDEEDLLAGLSMSSSEVKDEIDLARRRAQSFAEASPIIPIVNIEKETVESKVTEEKPLDDYVPPKVEITDQDRLYFNNIRRKRTESFFDGADNSQPNVTRVPAEDDPFTKILNDINFGSSKNESAEDFSAPTMPIFEKPVEPIVQEKEEKPPVVNHVEQEAEQPLGSIEEYITHNEKKPQIDKYETVETSPMVKPTVVEKPKQIKPKHVAKYNPPSLNVLKDYAPENDDTDFAEKTAALSRTLQSFKLNAEIVQVIKGPTFSRIDFRLEEGTPLNKLTARKDDIKMGLAVESLRLLAPIPGTSLCGVEIPNKKRSTVGIKAIITNPEFQNKNGDGLFFGIGQDIANVCYVADLTKMPHLLIAGSTNSGKSIALNVMITSMLYKYSPQDLRMILFDPKQVEFEIYKDLPHLLIPHILTEPQKAVNALKWTVDEMERRYTILTQNRVRSIGEYNTLDDVRKDASLKIPYILIVIDEFGDVVLSDVGKSFDIYVKRLAAKARAAGIHLVLATQRPSVDVINGTIKANLPSRIALRVNSGIDSMTILNMVGAEDLLGKGDMLYVEPTSSLPRRIQGAFVSTNEVISVVDQVVANNDKYFDEDIEKDIMSDPVKEEEHGNIEGEGKRSSLPDPLCVDALELCMQNNRVSTSFIQMKFGVGYPKAAKIVDWMTESGYVKTEGIKKTITATQQDIDHLRKIENGEE